MHIGLLLDGWARRIHRPAQYENQDFIKGVDVNFCKSTLASVFWWPSFLFTLADLKMSTKYRKGTLGWIYKNKKKQNKDSVVWPGKAAVPIAQKNKIK